MTRVLTIGGTALITVTQLDSINVGGRADRGASTISEVVVYDDTNALFGTAERFIRKQWSLTENASGTAIYLGRGRVAAFETHRGDEDSVQGVKVQYTFSLEDQNLELKGFDVHGWIRPSETDYARVQALGAAYLNGSPRATTDLDYSTYVPNTNTVTMPAKTYDDSDAIDVLADCASAADKTFFVTVDHELFYDDPTSTAYASTIEISDGVAGATAPDNSTYFAPIWDSGAALTWEGQQYASRVRLSYTDGSVLVSDSASEANHDYWVGRVLDSDTTAALGTAVANAELAARGLGVRSYQVSLHLTAAQAYKVKVGQMIWIQAQAPVDATGRVRRRIVDLKWEPDGPGWYFARMTLDQPIQTRPRSNNLSGGDSPHSDLIRSCACIETFTRTESGTLGTSEINGRGWQLSGLTSAVGYATTVDGSVALINFASASVPGDVIYYVPVEGVQNRPFEILAKIRADGGVVGAGIHLAEGESQFWLGVGEADGLSSEAGDDAHAFFRLALEDDETTRDIKGNMSFQEDDLTGASSTQITLLSYDNDSNTGPWFWVRYHVSHNTGRLRVWLDGDAEPTSWNQTFSNTPTMDYEATSELVTGLWWTALGGDDNNHNVAWAIDYIEVISGIWCCTYAPASGQWFTGEEVGYADGSSTVYNIPVSSAYVPGSLRVWVDGIEQTAAVSESDPSTGEFTFSFTPESSELITASWRVA